MKGDDMESINTVCNNQREKLSQRLKQDDKSANFNTMWLKYVNYLVEIWSVSLIENQVKIKILKVRKLKTSSDQRVYAYCNEFQIRRCVCAIQLVAHTD